MVRRYETDQFKGFFLGDRAVLDILFKFDLGMESVRKNDGFILDLLMQFKQNYYANGLGDKVKNPQKE